MPPITVSSFLGIRERRSRSFNIHQWFTMHPLVPGLVTAWTWLLVSGRHTKPKICNCATPPLRAPYLARHQKAWMYQDNRQLKRLATREGIGRFNLGYVSYEVFWGVNCPQRFKNSKSGSMHCCFVLSLHDTIFLAMAKAFFKSSKRSSGSSSPTLIRSKPGGLVRRDGGSILARCSISVSVPPKLVAR
jgi:hypothetical protein